MNLELWARNQPQNQAKLRELAEGLEDSTIQPLFDLSARASGVTWKLAFHSKRRGVWRRLLDSYRHRQVQSVRQSRARGQVLLSGKC